MATREQIVETARALVGARFKDQGRSFETGVDCAGVIEIVARTNGLLPDDYKPKLDYGRFPAAHELQTELLKWTDAVHSGLNDLRDGDIVIFYDARWASHAGISATLAPTLRTVIHATLYDRRVVEHLFDGYWRARSRGVFRFRGVEE